MWKEFEVRWGIAGFMVERERRVSVILGID
jgi:hypothetical protein